MQVWACDAHQGGGGPIRTKRSVISNAITRIALCGKTTTNIRVNAAVIHDLSYRPTRFKAYEWALALHSGAKGQPFRQRQGQPFRRAVSWPPLKDIPVRS